MCIVVSFNFHYVSYIKSVSSFAVKWRKTKKTIKTSKTRSCFCHALKWKTTKWLILKNPSLQTMKFSKQWLDRKLNAWESTYFLYKFFSRWRTRNHSTCSFIITILLSNMNKIPIFHKEVVQGWSRTNFIDIHPLDFPNTKKNHSGLCLAFEGCVVRIPTKGNFSATLNSVWSTFCRSFAKYII